MSALEGEMLSDRTVTDEDRINIPLKLRDSEHDDRSEVRRLGLSSIISLEVIQGAS